MLLIYHPKPGPRLNYIVSVLFRGAALVTSDRDALLQHQGPIINYSAASFSQSSAEESSGSFLNADTAPIGLSSSISKILQILPHGLLDEEGIHLQKIIGSSWRGLPAFFHTSDEPIPFDIFAASFYLLSRYEEYLPHETDLYGRFPHQASIAFKNGFLDKPLIQLWMHELEQILREYFDDYQLPATHFEWIPTYDIDIAYSYLHQPLAKNLYGFFRDLLKGKFELFEERALVYSGKQKDPFDVYEWLHDLHRRSGLHPVYFFLLAAKRKGVDRNIPPDNDAMKQLIRAHQQWNQQEYQKVKLQGQQQGYRIGIHPSWQSGDDPNLLKDEINRLQTITNSPVLLSRQHYLRMRLPDTYQQLMAAGIKQDYTMGYGTINGFRASYTLPFYWYDLSREQVTDLEIHPFCYMDANAVFEMHYPVYEAKKELETFYRIVQQVGGKMITIFHNHFLTDQPEWIEWKKMYEDFIAGL